MKRILIFFYYLLLASSLAAQVGHGGRPHLKPANGLDAVVKEIREMDQLPAHVLQLSRKIKKDEALRFAHPYFVELTPDNSGEWTTGEDGTRIWRLGIRSQGAYSINVIFDRFLLAPGASVYIFDPMQRLVLGSFTHLNNQPTGNLATAPVPGDELIVELHVPAGVEKKSILMIGAINHDYLNLFPNLKGGIFEDSGDCNVDLSCSGNDLWTELGRSVCKIIVDGTLLCSGTLLNNTANDGKPYFLTAAHCLRETNSASTVVFYFNYQVPNCETTIEGTSIQTLSGSTKRAYAELLDFALLEMTSIPPATYRPVWAGWSRATTQPDSVVAIHHPEGDVKKISFSKSAPIATTFYSSSYFGNSFVSDSHWRVANWQSGTTEGGSSGGGLFNNKGLLIGGLSGGEAYCGNSINDYFARFNKAWNHFPEIDKQLAYWLDPVGASPETTSSFDLYNNQAERLTNFDDYDNATVRYLKSGSGVWSGHNSLNVKSIGEEYAYIKSATIHGVYIVTAKSAIESNKTVNVKIWNGLTENPVLIAAKNNISLGSLVAKRENLVMLNSPIETNGPFWVEVELNYSVPIDSFAVYQSAPQPAHGFNTARIKNSENEWIGFNDYDADNYPSSFWIDVLATDVQRLDSSINEPLNSKLVVYPNPMCNQLNIKLDKSGPAVVELYNMVGQQVDQKDAYFFKGEATINFNDLSSGLHIIKLTIAGKVYVQKIMVECSIN
jgi:V8-like Glu-specific endopeptidase